MADQIRYNLNVQVEFGLYKRDIVAMSRVVSLSEQGQAGGIMLATTGDDGEAIDFADVSEPGWLYLRNLDDENFVTWGPDDGAGGLVAAGKLKPGEDAWFRIDPAATIRVRADTTTCKVQFEVFSD